MRLLPTLLLLAALPMHASDTPPAMGWSTYNYFIGSHNDALMRSMGAAFIASGMRDAGYNILRIDGGWWGRDDQRRWYYWTTNGTYAGGAPYQSGDPHVDPANYPQGLKGLADHLHAQSFKLGFYLSPALSTGISPNFPDYGTTMLQPTLQGAALIDRHARFVADSGVDHLFYDGYDWDEAQGTAPYLRMSSSLAAESSRVSRRIMFSINSGWKWQASSIADEWRTSRDINGEWSTIMECIGSVANTTSAGNGRWSNPDYLMAGFPEVTDQESLSQMSLWCVVAAPLYTSFDFRGMTSWDRYVLLNTEAIAVNQQLSAPGQRRRSNGGHEVWSRTLDNGSVAAVLLNTSGTPADITVSWNELGISSGQARVRDLWTHADLGVKIDSYTAGAIPPHGSAMVVIKNGAAVISPLATNYSVFPGVKPHRTPVDTTGWTMPSGGGFADAGATFDRNPVTTASDYARAGTSFEIALPAVRTLNELLIDQGGVGPNPWPQTVYVPRTTFKLEASADNGATYTQVASGSLGPAYTSITFNRTGLNRLRFTFVQPESTSAYRSEPRPSIKDIYAFDSGQTIAAGDVNNDGMVNSIDRDLINGHFGRASSDASYVPAYDLTGDGRVDAADVALVLRLQTP